MSFYHLSHQQSPLRLNEYLGCNIHPLDVVSSWSEMPENFLYWLCVCVSFLLSAPPPRNSFYVFVEILLLLSHVVSLPTISFGTSASFKFDREIILDSQKSWKNNTEGARVPYAGLPLLFTLCVKQSDCQNSEFAFVCYCPLNCRRHLDVTRPFQRCSFPVPGSHLIFNCHIARAP